MSGCSPAHDSAEERLEKQLRSERVNLSFARSTGRANGRGAIAPGAICILSHPYRFSLFI